MHYSATRSGPVSCFAPALAIEVRTLVPRTIKLVVSCLPRKEAAADPRSRESQPLPRWCVTRLQPHRLHRRSSHHCINHRSHSPRPIRPGNERDVREWITRNLPALYRLCERTKTTSPRVHNPLANGSVDSPARHTIRTHKTTKHPASTIQNPLNRNHISALHRGTARTQTRKLAWTTCVTYSVCPSLLFAFAGTGDAAFPFAGVLPDAIKRSFAR